MKYSFTLLLCFSLFIHLSGLGQAPKLAPAMAAPPTLEKSLEFIQNKSQWDKSVRFRANLPGGHLYLQNSGFLYNFYDDAALAHQHANPQAQNEPKDNQIKGHAYSLTFLGATTTSSNLTGKNATPALRNYFIGDDPGKWATNVKAYEEVDYQNLYPGISMQIYEKETHLKYDFTVQPYTNPSVVRMQYQGASQLSLVYGDLHIKTSVNEVIEKKPVAYQQINGAVVPVPCQFKLEQNVVSFEFPNGYDKSQTLVIDPTLVFSTFSGSSADNWGFTATYDNDGNLYSGGIVLGVGFPTTLGQWNGDIEPGGVYDGFGNLINNQTAWDVGILKYNTNASGSSALLYATYLGGNRTEIPSSLVVNSKNELLILGSTSSSNYPTTAGAVDRTFNNPDNTTFISPLNGIVFGKGTDLFVTRLSADGARVLASTFLGGSSNEGIFATYPNGRRPVQALDKNYGDQFRGDIITDAADNVYIVSSTQSANFPVKNGFQQTYGQGTNDAIVAKFTTALSLEWSSFLGGSGADAAYSIQLDSKNNIFIAGGTTSSGLPSTTGAYISGFLGGRADGFVAKISNNGAALQRLSYIGTDQYDQTYFVQLDANDDVYLLGQTLGQYPVSQNVYTNANGKQFIHKLSNDLTTSIFSTVFGATDATASSTINISPTAFLVDNCSRIYVSGWGGGANGSFYGNGSTYNLPVTNDAYQRTTDGQDFYLLLLSQNAQTLEYATYFGGVQASNGHGEHVDGGTSRFDKRGFVYQAVCGGCGGISAFPTTPGAWSRTNRASNCNNAAFKFDVNVPVAVAGNDETICSNQPAYQLSGFTPLVGGTWSGPGVTPTGTFNPIGLEGTITLTYTVKTGSCESISTKTITVKPTEPISFTGLTPQICLPANALTLIPSVPGGSFTGPGIFGNTFDPAVAGVGNHTITYAIINPEGCTVTSSQTITVNIMPAVIAGPDERICSGSFPIMLAGFSPAGGTWSGTGISADGLFTPSEALVGTHVLSYTVANDFCVVTQTKTVIVEPTIQFSQGPVVALCPDVPAFQIPAITPAGGTWSGTGVSADGVFTPGLGLGGINTLTYSVTIGACNGIVTQEIMVYPQPLIKAAAEPTECGTDISIEGFIPFTANFTNATTGATGYLWEFGDGATSREATPTHEYTQTGQYEVSLTAYYGQGCSVTQKVVAVRADKNKLVPNVFTPNNDGLNDTFVPRITCLPTDLRIFNRWGKLVYEQKNYQNTWRGEGITDGIYYYQLTSTKGQIWKGWVEIIR